MRKSQLIYLEDLDEHDIKNKTISEILEEKIEEKEDEKEFRDNIYKRLKKIEKEFFELKEEFEYYL